jgi:hypothetical protein
MFSYYFLLIIAINNATMLIKNHQEKKITQKILLCSSSFLAHFLQKVPQPLHQGTMPDFSTSFPWGISL